MSQKVNISDDDEVVSAFETFRNEHKKIDPHKLCVIPRFKNKSYPKNLFRDDQTSYYKLMIGKQNNLDNWSLMSTKQRDIYILEMIHMMLLKYDKFVYYSDPPLKKFELLDEHQLYDRIYNRFNTKRSIEEKKHKIQKTIHHYSTKNDFYANIKILQKDPISKTFGITKLYDHWQVQNYKHEPYYSCICSLYDPFNIIMYDYSHKVKKPQPIHRITKVKVRVPTDCKHGVDNCVIVFRDRTVHCGAESQRLNLFDHSMDPRLFFYINKKKQRNTVFTNIGIKNDKDVMLCQDDCCKCDGAAKKTKYKFDDTMEHIVDVEKLIENMKGPGVGQDVTPGTRLVGCLNTLGWAVYVGPPIRKRWILFNLLKSLKKHKVTQGLDNIDAITLKNKQDGRNRRHIKFDTVTRDQKIELKDIADNVMKVLIEQNKDDFSNDYECVTPSIIFNRNYCDEQEIHRDYILNSVN